ncbi:hypothetical protein LSM04_003680 [Trypanosoma melophagium]|uniref:uncharacterized protein n=1 Tax=Trypanosoma melophagium TaxID=715481 RepID=UPI00351A0B3F|nr:hypothetical protein LSM04_003680 [Trypanosoma melophagium]
MEQHMYTYLNQRYGLKHIILDWATAIIHGVKKYAPEENDVVVFGKILRNEIDEEFRSTSNVVKYMYNTEDAVSVIMHIRDHLRQISQSYRRRTTQKAQEVVQKDEVQLSYIEFIRILLNFQLEGHKRFLGRFLAIFRQHDHDRNGIVNAQEFAATLKSLDSSKTDEDVNAVLEPIDPFGNQLITYSECVTFLSTEIVKMKTAE